MTLQESQIAYKISIRSMVVNLLLFVFKLVFGILISSASLISDAVHSLTDIFSTWIVLIGIKISNKPSDSCHPYGHEKIECIVAFLLGIMLFVIGGSIGWTGIKKIISPVNTITSATFLNTYALIVAGISIVTKEWMYRFTIACAKKINSSSMLADAWHHRSDALSSIGSLAGVFAIRLGYPSIDAVACLVISIFIFKAAFDICADSCQKLIDTSCSLETIEKIENIIQNNDDVLELDVMKTRQYGSKIYVDLEITVDQSLSLVRAHEIAQSIHDEIEQTISVVKHCMVHVNPSVLTDHHHI